MKHKENRKNWAGRMGLWNWAAVVRIHDVAELAVSLHVLSKKKYKPSLRLSPRLSRCQLRTLLVALLHDSFIPSFYVSSVTASVDLVLV